MCTCKFASTPWLYAIKAYKSVNVKLQQFSTSILDCKVSGQFILRLPYLQSESPVPVE